MTADHAVVVDDDRWRRPRAYRPTVTARPHAAPAPDLAQGPAAVPAADADLVAALLAGDERVFDAVVRAWSPGLLRVARAHVSTDASAQEVVQDTWLAVVRGLAGYEGRASLRTWAFRVLVNTAKTRGVREARVLPMGDDHVAAVDPARFRPAGERWARHWTDSGAPHAWDGDPAADVLRGEVRVLLGTALDLLPPRQREVVVLRDIEGMSAAEVCQVLGLSGPNQRLLLHRGRARVRASLERYYRGEPS